MRLIPRSVRLRLTLWYTAALALVVLVFSLSVFLLVRADLEGEVQLQLTRDLRAVESFVRTQPGQLREITEYETENLILILRDGEVLYHTAEWENLGLEQAVEDRAGDGRWRWTSPRNRDYRLMSGSLPTPGGRLRIVVAQDTEEMEHTLGRLALILSISSPAVLLLALAGGYFLAGRVLSPIGKMARKAQEITAERLSERLPVENREDEFGRLATIFNHTLERLEDAFERLRRFTADASHELRTPLTAIRSVGEVGLSESLEPGTYREVIGSMLEEVDRLARLLDSLLLLTRADAGERRVVREELDAAALAADVCGFLNVLAEEKDQTLTVDGEAAARVRADPTTLRQALVNLVDNAIRYTPRGGHVTVRLRRDPAGGACVEVADDGPGIAPEHQPRVFERFYRIERARTRQPGGAGLGLAIARSAVVVNGGRLELDSDGQHGCTFRIVLPPA